MKILLTLLLSFISIAFVNGQNYDKSAILYSNFHLPQSSGFAGFCDCPNKKSDFRFRTVTPALHLKNTTSSLYHEIELFDLFVFSKNQDKTTRKGFISGLRYEIGIDKNVDKKFNFYHGLFVRPFFSREKIASNFEFGDINTTIRTGLSIGYSPHLQYQLNEQFGVVLNLPINFVGLSYNHTNTESLSQNFSSNNFEFPFFPKEFILKFGVTYKLSNNFSK